VQDTRSTFTYETGGSSAERVDTFEQLTPEAAWAEISACLKKEVPIGHFSAWFSQARGVALDEQRLFVAVPGRFAADWIENRYLERLNTLASATVGRPLEVTLRAEAPAAAEEPPHTIRLDAPPAAHGETRRSESSFHPKYSFESFVIGASNRFAHAATLAVAEAPAQAYNPLFIYGGAGLGKTHLLHAIGHYTRQYHPALTVRYVSTEQFTNEFIVALQRRTIPEFHARYRAADVLLIDDIQFLATRERTQEEFFHTFNALHPSSQLVITSDRPPKRISSLEERLRTRFEWGLISDIQPPDLETRLAILRTKAEIDGIKVPDDALDYIASRIQTNVRELEGALIRVAAYASLTRSEVTLELATNVLRSLLTDATEARVTSDLVMSVAAEYFDVTLEELVSSKRSRPLVNARQIAMYLCRELTELSLPKIGERFGGRDHSTVIHATNKIRDRMKEHTTSYEQVEELTTRIRQQAARG
jgi:chromosomal replication initiator protein